MREEGPLRATDAIHTQGEIPGECASPRRNEVGANEALRPDLVALLEPSQENEGKETS